MIYPIHNYLIIFPWRKGETDESFLVTQASPKQTILPALLPSAGVIMYYHTLLLTTTKILRTHTDTEDLMNAETHSNKLYELVTYILGLGM